MIRNVFFVLSLTLFIATRSQASSIGINVLLNQPVNPSVLAELSMLGTVLEVIPEINAVTMRAQSATLPDIQALTCVAGANRDARRSLAGARSVITHDHAGGANIWNLDAINVTESHGSPVRTVDKDGDGVYVAIIDSGLYSNWREYFPEQRIATQFARAFGGGGGDSGTVSSQPTKWERDTFGHGTAAASIILGFRYVGPESLPHVINGVAPKATIIPIRVGMHETSEFWSSVGTRALVYLVSLKTSGALGDAPLVVSMSFGSTHNPDFIEQAAIDYAIANGVIVVAAGGNEAELGMSYPAAYAPVISVGATGFRGQFPEDDPTTIVWILDDVFENDAQEHFVADFSSHELPGQDLDVLAPGMALPTPWTNQQGHPDYSYFGGTSGACPHVAGVAALLLQKNAHLSQFQIESILESTAMRLSAGCRTFMLGNLIPGNPPTWGDHNNVIFVPATFCWGEDAAGAGMVQADTALLATPLP